MKKKQVLYMVGRPFSPFYSLLMRFRAFLYRIGILRVTRSDVFVVSVGNLTMGGSGKTPVVQYLARFLQGNGWNPAIISRGYSGSAKQRVNLVSDGTNVMLDAAVAGGSLRRDWTQRTQKDHPGRQSRREPFSGFLLPAVVVGNA